ncbi:MAG: cysteine--tRNA ligase [Gaiellales bacterium]
MRLYSTLTRRAEELPGVPGPIRMYFCGPTVYQRVHVGNARPFVVSMWLRRYLASRGYDVTLVENVTDINDKIYDAARQAGTPSARLAETATRWYVEDTDRLEIGRPDHEPLASEAIEEIVSLIGELLEGGLAYPAGGDVYFRVSRFPDYGHLSNQRPEEMADQEPNPIKEDPRDFALWKATKHGEDTSWPAPWGEGRPGWHIECSAMAEKFLGTSFEIHGGGLDLVFPHHENEVAQSRGAGREFARIWMHNGMLRLTGEKMSKSLGNVATLRSVLDGWGRETLLLFFMTGLWRSPIDFSDGTMRAAAAQVETFRNCFLEGEAVGAPDTVWDEIIDALDDDFNTPEALAVMHSWRSRGYLEPLGRGLELFGLGSLATPTEAPAELHEMAIERVAARDRKDFPEADRIRDEIERRGWEVRDRTDGYHLVPKA